MFSLFVTSLSFFRHLALVTVSFILCIMLCCDVDDDDDDASVVVFASVDRLGCSSKFLLGKKLDQTLSSYSAPTLSKMARVVMWMMSSSTVVAVSCRMPRNLL